MNERDKLVSKFGVRRPYFRRAVRKSFVKPSRVQQQFAKETDINEIMRKYKKTGLITHVNQYQAMYGDFISAPDFQDAQQAIADANQMFSELPAEMRDRFGNDPVKFLDFVQAVDADGNAKNIEEMRSLGLWVDRPPADATINDIHNELKRANELASEPVKPA